jgi:branched-chain amino acid transport system permease protein
MEYLIAGLATGAIYGLMAVGVVIVFITTNRANFAQGEVLMLGGYAYWLATRDNLGPFLQVALVVLVGVALGVLFFVLIHVLMRTAEELTVVIATLGVSIILITAIRLLYTDNPAHVGGFLTGDSVVGIGSGSAVPTNALTMLGVGLGATVLAHVWLQRSRTGQALRAVAESPQDAAYAGIPVRRMLLFSWIAGCAFATISGLLFAPAVNVYPAMGADVLFKGFVAAALGGFGSVIGAMAGGLMLGVLEIESTRVFGSDIRDVLSFGVLLLALLIRPQGLFGKPVLRRV